MRPNAFQEHQATNLFPPTAGAEYQALKGDIRANGQREPILIYEGEVVDGRARQQACHELGIPVQAKMVEIGENSIFNLIADRNFTDHLLTVGQRALMGVKLQEAFRWSAEKAGQWVGVSATSVKRAKWLKKNGANWSEKVWAGEMSLDAAAAEAKRHIAVMQMERQEFEREGRVDG